MADDAAWDELFIKNTPVKSIGSLNMDDLTIGQIIVLGQAVQAVQAMMTFKDGADTWATPATAERRGGGLADLEFNTVNGPMKLKDMPHDRFGRLDPEWISRNCPCDKHERDRIEADRNQ